MGYCLVCILLRSDMLDKHNHKGQMKYYRHIFLLIFLAFSSLVFASSSRKTFTPHRNKIFVETGSYIGKGIKSAMRAKFKEIHSIELSEKYYNICKNKFINNSQVNMHLGDSGKILFDIISGINEPITFWLDGHCSGGDTALGESCTALLQELEQIKRHPIKSHTILIDDVRLFGTKEFDYISKETIIEKLLEINPNYKISYQNGHVKNDILVAKVR